MTPIELIVGLGNPGPEYDKTRHNAGAWLVETLAADAGISLRSEKKFHGLFACLPIGGQECRLLLPTTFMNHSGQALKAIAQFYKLKPESILIAHDELDLPPGEAKLKRDGGHAGHNGLRDIINHLGNKNFLRLRLGIGHPGDRDRVSDYVLSRPSQHDAKQIHQAIADCIRVLPTILSGDIDKATRTLHSES